MRAYRALVLLGVALVGAMLARPLPPGLVSDADGPVAGAMIRYQGGTGAVCSDPRGRFGLPPRSGAGKRLTAWKSGHAIGWAEPGQLRIELVPLPQHDNDDYAWQLPTPDELSPNNCGNCHAAIYRDWASSGHGRAATNPRVHAVQAAVVRDRPDDGGVCAKCHAPTYRDPGLDYTLATATGHARAGVHCDFCHKIVEAPTDKLGRRFGVDGYDLLRPSGDLQLFFGPLDDAVRPGERFGYLPLYKQSRYCASCHEGTVYGISAYTTYSEWLASPARAQGQQCQTCHMAATGELTNIAPGKGGVERDPWSLSSHATPGGSLAMLRRALRLMVTLDGSRAVVELLADNVGHRVPTGFIDRHLLLVATAVNPSGEPIELHGGPRLPAAVGRLGGQPGQLFARFLPDPNSGQPTPFWLMTADPPDTRLIPGQLQRIVFAFAAAPVRLRVRLIYRKDWGDPGVAVFDGEIGGKQ